MRTMQKLLCGGFLMFMALTLGVHAQYSGVGNFVEISSLDELEDGYYVIASTKTGGSAFVAMDSAHNGTLFPSVDISPINGVLENPPADIVWKIFTDNEGRAIFSEQTEKYASYTGSSNNIQVTDDIASDNQRWTFAINNDLFRVENLGVAGRFLQYNRSSPRFVCYTGTQTDLTLFKLSTSSTGLSIGFNKADGFVVFEGSTDSITATASNGAEPYDYEWSSTLDAAHYSTNANIFTILATAPTGSYSATVTVTDDDSASTNRTINFEVATAYAITIDAGIVNGTVSTLPSGNVLAGQSVAITATPESGYYRSALTVVGDISQEAVTLTGTTFVMPAESVTVSAVFSPLVLPEGILVAWDVAQLATVESVSSVLNADGVTASTISIETSALVATSGTNSFNMNTWSLGTTLEQAITDQSYFEFTVSAEAGKVVAIDQIAWRIVRSSGGPNTFALLSSVGGFTDTAIIGSVLTYTNTSAASLNPAFEDIGIAGQTQVTFRVYGWGALGTSGSARITDGGNFGGATAPGIDFAIFGSVVDGDGPGPDPDAVEVTGFTVVGGNPAATFTAVAGRSYYLVYTTDLTAITTVTPPVLGQWQVAASITDATAGIQTLTDTSATDAARFYGILETLSPLP